MVACINRSYDIFQVGAEPNVMRMLDDELVSVLLSLTIATPRMKDKCRVGRIGKAH